MDEETVFGVIGNCKEEWRVTTVKLMYPRYRQRTREQPAHRSGGEITTMSNDRGGQNGSNFGPASYNKKGNTRGLQVNSLPVLDARFN